MSRTLLRSQIRWKDRPRFRSAAGCPVLVVKTSWMSGQAGRAECGLPLDSLVERLTRRWTF
jgi:hypothetical protein